MMKMIFTRWICSVALGAFLSPMLILAQAPFTITTPSAKTTPGATGQGSVYVPITAGYAYNVLLDGQRLPAGITNVITAIGYHEVNAWRTNLSTGAVTNRLIQFTIRSSERQEAEDGIAPWIPYAPVMATDVEWQGSHLNLLMPTSFPAGYPIPVVAWAMNSDEHAVRLNGLLKAPGQPDISIRRGVGSGIINSGSGTLHYEPYLGDVVAARDVQIESSTTWTDVSGIFTTNINWPDNARIRVLNDITLQPGVTLTVGAGVVVVLGNHVDITNNGSIVINGTVSNPTVFMPYVTGQPWGGIVQHANNTRLEATGTIFTGSGAVTLWFDSQFGSAAGPHSHRGEQALFSLNGSGVTTRFVDSAAIYLYGQLGHAYASSDTVQHQYNMTFTRFLMQHVTTGGEYTGADFTVNDSAFINAHSNGIPFQTFVNGDEDGLYLVNGTHCFTNSLIGWTRDDGIDSGGSGPGVFNYKNCWFESIYHEGNSLSGVQSSSAHADKMIYHYDSVYINCGQGVENGYGAVTNREDHCLMVANRVGFRYGDNYNWSYYGVLKATNCISINNTRDVWGMNFQDWTYRISAMNVCSNFFSAPNSYHPSNFVWNPTADGWRLAAFKNSPATAPVGIAFAVYTNQIAMSNLFNGVPVGLSIFTPETVSVDYSFESGSETLATGTLVFQPGETLKLIYPAGFTLSSQSQVRLVLSNAVGGMLTGETIVTASGSVPTAQVRCVMGGNQGDIEWSASGMPLKLTTPASQIVSVDYTIEANGKTVASGTVVFQPGETLAWIPMSGFDLSSCELVRLNMNASGATMATPNSLVLVKTIPPPPSIYYVAHGSRWTYYDKVTSAIANWQATNFNDSAWSNGLSSLGYGNTPKESTTVSYAGTSSAKSITTYFRTSFVATNTSNIASLTFNLLRDDGAAVYWNGQQLFLDNLAAGAGISTPSGTNVSNTASVWNTRTFNVASLPSPLNEGTNYIAVEIHQSGAGSSDILMDLEVIANPKAASGNNTAHISWDRFGTNLVMGWSSTNFMQWTTNVVDGPWYLLSTNSPLVLPPQAVPVFYRLK